MVIFWEASPPVEEHFRVILSSFLLQQCQMNYIGTELLNIVCGKVLLLDLFTPLIHRSFRVATVNYAEHYVTDCFRATVSTQSLQSQHATKLITALAQTIASASKSGKIIVWPVMHVNICSRITLIRYTFTVYPCTPAPLILGYPLPKLQVVL